MILSGPVAKVDHKWVEFQAAIAELTVGPASLDRAKSADESAFLGGCWNSMHDSTCQPPSHLMSLRQGFRKREAGKIAVHLPFARSRMRPITWGCSSLNSGVPMHSPSMTMIDIYIYTNKRIEKCHCHPHATTHCALY